MPLNPMRNVAGAASITLYLTDIPNGLSLLEAYLAGLLLWLLLCSIELNSVERTEAMSASPSTTLPFALTAFVSDA